ncbi:STAS domain-containing protein [Rhizobium halophytocola]|uniref:Chemotaxis protein CheX n=1 Tax=Rhizobium halophytocola TaxID=735519 RepID=A0ABS4E5A4_9HYPH|nr:STAS domain-containing protein [Rhizobium halophytocola]MBP1853093.1 chemotaxis protein CheX [Rhizobium halophytocola]
MATKKSEQGTFTLAAVLDLNEASNLKANLLSLRGKPLSIDASAVERVGAQCVQVLMSAAQTWEKDGKPFLISKASEAFKMTMQLIGVNVEHLLAKE